MGLCGLAAAQASGQVTAVYFPAFGYCVSDRPRFIADGGEMLHCGTRPVLKLYAAGFLEADVLGSSNAIRRT